MSVVPADALLCPGPQRVNLLLLCSIWIWYAVLRLLNASKIDATAILQINLPGDMHQPPTQGHLQRQARKFAVKTTKIVLPLHILTVFLFQTTWANDSNANELGESPLSTIQHLLPLCQLILIVILILRESKIVRYACGRLPLIEPEPRALRNVYILLSDSLTSFTRPLIEFLLFTSLLLSEPLTDLDLFLSSIPSLIRIIQCLREYRLVGHPSLLGNSLKYSSNLPILACTWYSRVYTEQQKLNNPKFKSIQLCFLLINSTFSYLWDIKMDWHLSNFVSIRNGKSHTVFNKNMYRFAIVTNFILRFWWLWLLLLGDKSSSLKFLLFDGELQYLEIIRRAQWVIFKLETEYVFRPISKTEI